MKKSPSIEINCEVLFSWATQELIGRVVAKRWYIIGNCFEYLLTWKTYDQEFIQRVKSDTRAEWIKAELIKEVISTQYDFLEDISTRSNIWQFQVVPELVGNEILKSIDHMMRCVMSGSIYSKKDIPRVTGQILSMLTIYAEQNNFSLAKECVSAMDRAEKNGTEWRKGHYLPWLEANERVDIARNIESKSMAAGFLFGNILKNNDDRGRVFYSVEILARDERYHFKIYSDKFIKIENEEEGLIGIFESEKDVLQYLDIAIIKGKKDEAARIHRKPSREAEVGL